MSAFELVQCDFCGELLKGKKGVAWINKDHIMIKGRMAFEHWNPEDRKWEYRFMSESEYMDLHFCSNGGECIADYFEYRTKRALKELMGPLPLGGGNP